MSNKLTAYDMKKKNKEIENKIVKIEVLGKELNIKTFFKNSQILTFLEEFEPCCRMIFERQPKLDFNSKAYTAMMCILLIKHFTDMEIKGSFQTIQGSSKAMKLYDQLLDIELLPKIFNVFPKEEINKIFTIGSISPESLDVLIKYKEHLDN